MSLELLSESAISSNLFYLIFFIGTTLLAILLNGLLVKFSKTLGIRNHDETIFRWSAHSKPALGGIGFYIIFLLSITFTSLFFNQNNELMSMELLGLLAATSLGFLMGLSDDAYNTKPLLKLGAQIGCGLILAATGTCIDLFDSMVLNYLLTIFWVVGIMNSINMLDNMDAITTTVSICIVGTAVMVEFLCGDCSYIPLIALVGVGASLIGFLFFNWNPSKMFMGDTGSQFLGTFLAAVGIVYFWNNPGFEGAGGIGSQQIIIVLLAFIIPIVDTTTVTINRLRRKQSPFVGGKDHTTHNLSYLGLSDRQVALVMAGISLVSFGLIFFMIKFIDQWSSIHVLIFGGYTLCIFGFLFGATHLKRAKAKFYEQERRRQEAQAAAAAAVQQIPQS